MGLMSGIAGLFSDSEGYYSGVRPPDPETMKLALEEYVQQGILTPEDAQMVMADPSAFEQITSNPKFQEAQMRALEGLQDVYEQEGLTATSKARLHDIAKNEGIRERGAREAILSNAAERGTSGSGLEFLSQLKNQQESAGRVSARDTQVAADAEQRALQALIDSGTMAGNIRGQDFSEKARIAEAADAINRFNTQNQNQFNLYNTGARNEAQARNLQTKQNIHSGNVDLRNKQQAYNRSLPQQNFENKLKYAGARSGAYNTDQERKIKGIGEIEDSASQFMGAFI